MSMWFLSMELMPLFSCFLKCYLYCIYRYNKPAIFLSKISGQKFRNIPTNLQCPGWPAIHLPLKWQVFAEKVWGLVHVVGLLRKHWPPVQHTSSTSDPSSFKHVYQRAELCMHKGYLLGIWRGLESLLSLTDCRRSGNTKLVSGSKLVNLLFGKESKESW